MTYRIMVVGEQDWEEDSIIHRELSRVQDEVEHRTITLVTVGIGGHGKGAEAIAISIAGDLGWDVELYPPDYAELGTSPYLSAVAEMVDTHPHACLAFVNEEDSVAAIGGGMAETVEIPVLWFAETVWE